jgi:hypothetical protein
MTNLTEPGIRAYFIRSLNECKDRKLEYYTFWVNLCLFGIFVLIVGLTLRYKYKGKLTEEQKKTKHDQDRMYILNKIKDVQIKRQQESNELITNLPRPEHIFC